LNPTIEQLAASLDLEVTGLRPVTGGSICEAWQITTTTGTYFAKTAPTSTVGMFGLEAAGLTWLAAAGISTPRVIAVNNEALLLEWVNQKPPNSRAAHIFGAELARLHATAAPAFGCPPAESPSDTGWVGSLPVPFGHWDSWPEFYVHGRLRPAMTAAIGQRHLAVKDAQLVDRVCAELLANPIQLSGSALAARRIHGDLWSGNVLWTGSGATLIDPAAHGGHPESDLAMLQLFGAPKIDQILAGYEAATRLPTGWQDRVALHQLFPVLVHAALFGGGYGQQAGHLAAEVLP
jgi:fructosamine-3-kinase